MNRAKITSFILLLSIATSNAMDSDTPTTPNAQSLIHFIDGLLPEQTNPPTKQTDVEEQRIVIDLSDDTPVNTAPTGQTHSLREVYKRSTGKRKRRAAYPCYHYRCTQEFPTKYKRNVHSEEQHLRLPCGFLCGMEYRFVNSLLEHYGKKHEWNSEKPIPKKQ